MINTLFLNMFIRLVLDPQDRVVKIYFMYKNLKQSIISVLLLYLEVTWGMT